ncbi:MAG: hypothetical protein ABL893_09390 [Hyphomicrobium sp.]|nr:hypothetical protein [Hyphomicrobium sp.]
MTKAAQLWDIDKKRAFFRAYIQRETSLDQASADKLAEALTKAVNMMRVWEMPAPVEHVQAARPTPHASPAAGKSRSKLSAAETGAGASQPDAAAPFDPYAFSAMVVLAKTGKDGLLKRLAEIKSVEHLKAFADAQHLAVAPSLKKLDDLRKAIVAATEQRLADRKAAAS